MTDPRIHLIVAVGNNGIIGIDGNIPWKCKQDMRFFADTTMGSVLIMGRKTVDTIRKPLKGRIIIGISQTPKEPIVTGSGSILWASTFESAIEMAKEKTTNNKVFIAGGATIYDKALELGIVDEIHISHITDAQTLSPIGATTFPIDLVKNYKKWKIVEHSNYHSFIYRNYVRS